MSHAAALPTKIAEDIFALEMGMPGVTRTSWCYVLLNKDHTVTLIDPGWDMPENLAAILGFFRDRGIPLTDLAAIFTTHVHPDHFGWAAELSRRSGAQIYAPELEASHFFDKTQSVEFLAERWQQRAAQWGIPEEQLHLLEGGASEHIPAERALIHHYLPEGSALPGADPAWRLVWTPGHTAGMCCVVNTERKILFSTDHIMSGESPGLGLGGVFVVNPFRLYLDSVKTMAPFDGYLALPGHRQPFTDLVDQGQLSASHHQRRADEIGAVLRQDGQNLTLWELAQRVRWSGGFDSLHGFRLRSALHHVELFADYLLG